MKKFLALMLCLVMALTLVACAKEDKDKGNTDTDLPTDNQPNIAPDPNDNMGGTNGSTNGTTNGTTPGNGTPDDSAQSKSRQRNTVTDPYARGGLFDGNADSMATWEQMLDNGRVRDTDGFLWDGENASWS